MAILLKGGFGLLVELHWEGSAPSACAAGLFSKVGLPLPVSVFLRKKGDLVNGPPSLLPAEVAIGGIGDKQPGRGSQDQWRHS